MNRHIRKIAFLAADSILIILSFGLATFLVSQRFTVPPLQLFIHLLLWILVVKLLVYYVFSLYSSIWKYASIQEMIEVFAAATTASAISLFIIYPYANILWARILFVDWILNILLIGGIRLGLRVFDGTLEKARNERYKPKNVLVYGAGKIGAIILKELIEHPHYNPIGIIDDDRDKKGTRIHGVPVLGETAGIDGIVQRKEIREIIIAVPSMNKTKFRDTLDFFNKLGCKVKTVPGMHDLIDGRVSIKVLRDVNIEDLLGRTPVDLNIEEISEYIKGRTVLVTGGGGSIGSELCCQLARFSPEKLLVLDISENDPYMLQQELNYKFPDLKTKFLIGSITDHCWITHIFNTYTPDVVFHTAAHKHVPLMEENPYEAVKNNVFGTLNLAKSAAVSGAERFVLISTDKAVNPANIMGVTKRISEMIVQSMDRDASTKFSAVRFGNVLGSKGSVIPLFRKQIEWSNTIRVTHPDVTRYFMTITEAVQLVIQAGSMARGGEVFVLDMGKPVKILDLAKDLTRILGVENETQIIFTGLRPGEKRNEELFKSGSTLKRTHHEKIYVETANVHTPSISLNEQLESLWTACNDFNSNITSILAQIVPDYRENNRTQ